MEKLYYSPKCYWKGISPIRKLENAAGVSEANARVSQETSYLADISTCSKEYNKTFDVVVVDEVHQADVLFLPHDAVGKKKYKYALTVVDVASRYKEVEPLTSKESKKVALAFERIYARKLNYPSLLQVDPGREFMGSVSQLMTKHNVNIRRGHADIHRDQAMVERFNRTLGERLFGYQYAK